MQGGAQGFSYHMELCILTRELEVSSGCLCHSPERIFVTPFSHLLVASVCGLGYNIDG